MVFVEGGAVGRALASGSWLGMRSRVGFAVAWRRCRSIALAVKLAGS